MLSGAIVYLRESAINIASRGYQIFLNIFLSRFRREVVDFVLMKFNVLSLGAAGERVTRSDVRRGSSF